MLDYYMQKKIKICIKNFEIIVRLRNTKTAEIIWDSLPIQSKTETWGKEVYFFVSLSSNLDEDAKDVLNFGEIAYWSTGKAIVIGFGKTPLSYKDEIRLADKCNIWGDTEFDLRKLKSINSGELVGVKRC